MLKNTLIIVLVIVLIYLYYQNKKLKQLPPASSSDNSERTVFHLEETDQDLIADRDTAIREKKEAEQEVLALSNKLRNKQQEVNRKESEIDRVKKEKSQVEIALNQKIKELKKDNEDLKNKYSKQGQLLDEEQLESKKLTEEVEKLQEQITELKRPKSPMPGEWGLEREDELKKEHQEQLRKINLLFDENAANYESIDFEGLYSLLEEEVKKKKKNSRTPTDIQQDEEEGQEVDNTDYRKLAMELEVFKKYNIMTSKTEKQKFKEFLKKVEDPNYQREINRALPPNANSLQVAKYKLCKQMLIYQQEKKLSDEKIAKKIKLSVAEVEDILFCEIEKFTLDRLVDYAERLFSSTEIKLIVEPKKDNLHARTI